MKPEVPVTVRCKNCGTAVQIPPGGKRLCACGTWLSAAGPAAAPEAPPPVAQPAEAAPTAKVLPRIEGDLSAIERLNDGYRRILRELNKAIVGQQEVLEQMLIAI